MILRVNIIFKISFRRKDKSEEVIRKHNDRRHTFAKEEGEET